MNRWIVNKLGAPWGFCMTPIMQPPVPPGPLHLTRALPLALLRAGAPCMLLSENIRQLERALGGTSMGAKKEECREYCVALPHIGGHPECLTFLRFMKKIHFTLLCTTVPQVG